MPIRKLLRQAGEAVLALKPVFLMSPFSVAQYLDLDGIKFDLLLIDEASQVRPADAFGAIMRARRAIVVGDQKQLPPTAFFDRLASGEEEEEYSDLDEQKASQIKHMESILSLCEARGMPGCMLKWHYRSQHESLIAVSNREFYRNGLICPPSPLAAGGASGLSYQHVEGNYRRGRGRADNPGEAAVIVDEVLVHARQSPDLTLGIVAMSSSQQKTILNQIEQARAEHPELDRFCNEEQETPFFVKNLETVQGDERDIIFISIGYGKDKNGYFSQNFGPVSREGGERRLNVLFTRAKRRCKVFSSIRHTDIRLDAARHDGPRVLKTFLKYAETGEIDLPVMTGDGPDSPFEEAVILALQERGYSVDCQVGSAGFRIDLAVKDPDNPAQYILAVECDGARYHSSLWARERDRMRQVLLEAKGWTFHRIWSTDWFNNPDQETRKVVQAIRRAKRGSGPARRSAPARSRTPITRQAPAEPEKAPKGVPYESILEMSFLDRRITCWDRYDGPGKEYTRLSGTIVGPGNQKERSYGSGRELVELMVGMEGPVHADLIARCLRIAADESRVTRTVEQETRRFIGEALNAGTVIPCASGSDFFMQPNADVHVRDRSKVEEALLRKATMIPPLEIHAGVLEAVRRSIAITRASCVVDVARMLGFSRTGSALRQVIEQEIDHLLQNGRIRPDNGHMRLR